MALHRLPHLKIDKENPKDGIKELIRIIKPSWNLDCIKTEFLSGGYSSRIFRCFDDNDKNDQITVRIRNLMEDFEDWKNATELEVIEHLSTVGHFPTVHAIFANGYCYQYIPGKPVVNLKTRTGYIDDEILKAIAQEMVFVHSVKLPDTEYKCDCFEKHISLLPRLKLNSKLESAPPCEVLQKEFNLLDEFISSMNIPVTLCHGDSHPGNYVWNDIQKKLTFVDWEIALIAYRHYDIAYFIWFLEMLVNSTVTNITAPSDYESKFLKYYFDEWCKTKNETGNDNEFNEFVSTVQKFKLMPLLTFVTYVPFHPEIFEEVFGSVNSYYKTCITDYLKLKKKYFGSDKFEEL